MYPDVAGSSITRVLKKFSALFPSFFILLTSLFYLVAILLRHFRLESFGYDLGIYTQEVYKLSRFNLPYNTIKIPNMIIWGDHWTSSLAIFAPFVWIFKRPELVLLVSQVIFFFLASFLVYKIALSKTQDKLFAFMVLFAFSFFYGVQNAIFFDFHPFFIGSMLVPLIYITAERQKWASFFLLTFMLANLKENFPLYLVALGFVFLLSGKRRQGMLLVGFYTLWFLLTIKLFIPYFSPTGEYLYLQEFPGILPLIERFFTPAQKIQVVVVSFWNFSFLPLFSPFSVFLSGVNFLESFLGTDELAGRWGFDRHYKAMLGPVLAIGAVEGYLFLKSKLQRRFTKVRLSLLINTLLAAVFLQYSLHLQLNLLTKPEFWRIGENKKVVLSLAQKLRGEPVSIATQNNIAAHLSNRDKIYLLVCNFDTKDAEYILVDLTPNLPAVNFLGCEAEEAREEFRRLLSTGEYEVEFQSGEVYLLKKI